MNRNLIAITLGLGLVLTGKAWGQMQTPKLPAGLPDEVRQHINEHIEDYHEQDRPRQFKQEDFAFKNIKFQSKLVNYIEVSGEAQNLSGADLRTARFSIKVKGKMNQLMAQKDFYLSNFVRGKAVKFNLYVKSFDQKQMKNYEIKFEEAFYYDDRE